MSGYIPVGDPERKRETDRLSKRRRRAAARPAIVPVSPDLDPDWRARAGCRGTEPTVMDAETAEDERTARTLCADCPVFAECSAFADRVSATWGVWAGVNRSGTREAVAS